MTRPVPLHEVRSNDPESWKDANEGADLKPICAAQWAHEETPQRAWLVDDWIPMGRTTLLTGDGGTGKSLLAQQLATCVAAGVPFMGNTTRRMNALYLTCEDDLAELHRRQKAICQAERVTLSELLDRLFMLTRRGQLNNSLVHFDLSAPPETSEFYRELRRTCHDRAINFVVLDNVAHLFEGNENIRHQVATFCNAMERLAVEIGGAVLLLGHPPKGGAQFSGSTAWENQVRARLFLERPGADGEAYADPDLRTLSRSKANYAKAGEALQMKWRDWAFVASNDAAEGPYDLRDTAQATRENEIFLSLLNIRNEQRRAVSASPHAQNYAPKAMAKMPQAKGTKREAFERAMERLFALGTIEERGLWKGADRHPVRGLGLAGQLREGSANLRDGMAETGGNPRGKVAREGLRGGSRNLREGYSESGVNPAGRFAGQCGQVEAAPGGGEAPLKGGLSPTPYPEPSEDDIQWPNLQPGEDD